MYITVIVCTHNRCESLAKALDSVASSILPHSVQWKIVVVENNSKDSTREVVDGISPRYPGRFRYLFEARQGKSLVLNSGVREARGDVLPFRPQKITMVQPEVSNK
jgi:glucosyl-dolichyl phosphate glucuronosyltransferase